jgi:hypothetical protein
LLRADARTVCIMTDYRNEVAATAGKPLNPGCTYTLRVPGAQIPPKTGAVPNSAQVSLNHQHWNPGRFKRP